MSEVQQANQNNGDVAQRFIEFIMMQAQQAMLFLGKIPHPATGETMMNLEAAKMFIDYLEMLREKTRGNLSSDEEKVLGSILAELQLSFVQASNTASQEAASDASLEAPAASLEKTNDGEDHKKRFSKSYGS